MTLESFINTRPDLTHGFKGPGVCLETEALAAPHIRKSLGPHAAVSDSETCIDQQRYRVHLGVTQTHSNAVQQHLSKTQVAHLCWAEIKRVVYSLGSYSIKKKKRLLHRSAFWLRHYSFSFTSADTAQVRGDKLERNPVVLCQHKLFQSRSPLPPCKHT